MTQLALAQRRLGHDVSVFVDRKRTTTHSEELAVPKLVQLGLFEDSNMELSVKSSPLGLARDVAAIRRIEADVLHCHFTHDHVLAWLGRTRGTVLVRSLHAPRSARRLLAPADAWTVPMKSLAPRFASKPCVVLRPLVDESFRILGVAGSRTEERQSPAEVRVGMVSAFQRSRRHLVGLEAFARLAKVRRDARLVLVGDGPMAETIRARVSALGLDERTTFRGYLSGSAFVEALQLLDEVWILGLGNDWAGRAAVQARACGVRVVAVDEGALAQWADAVVEPTPEAICRAAFGSKLDGPSVPSIDEIAREIAELYDHAKERAR
jgi:glycosyltransferase involved in cell wall biosynthesis